jgi:hypothetical protein
MRYLLGGAFAAMTPSSRHRDVFLSHAAKDAAAATTLCRLLEARGVSCWIAPRDILPGRSYAEEILDAIEGTDATVLLLSDSSNGSVHVRNEIERAVHRRKTVYPVRLANVAPARSLELFVSTSQWIDAWDSLEHAADRLAQVVRANAGGEGPPAVYAPPRAAEPAAPPGPSASSELAGRLRTVLAPLPSRLRAALAPLLAWLRTPQGTRIAVIGAGALVGLAITWVVATWGRGPAVLVRLEGPRAAALTVDGEPAGALDAEPRRIALERGAHRIRVTAPGFVPFDRTVSVLGDEPVDVVASLAPAGWIALSVETPGAEVLVDGVAVADPRAPIEVAPGRRRVEVRAPGFASFTRQVDVRAGETADLAVTLRAGGGGRDVGSSIIDHIPRRPPLFR